ncbi:MAG TPA: phosphoadenylyl-sulfate reductase [Blastocatellia bacterium]|nr:phosphoadenylyl-sulfate reductase [Blastocatellia bacterium]
MTQLVTEIVNDRSIALGPGAIRDAAARLDGAAPEETLRWAFEEFGDRLTIATGFGAEGVALIDMAVKITANPNIFVLDTAFLFPETYELWRRIEDRYAIEIKSFKSELSPEQQETTFGSRLWARDPDLCCRLRKLEPLKKALRDRAAWVTAIRRDQTIERSTAEVVEWDYQWRLMKINPLLRWNKTDVWDYIRKHNVPYNELHDLGYPSIGCTHCTSAVGASEHDRAGRWAGRQKTECGLHARPRSLVVLEAASPAAD